MDKTIIKILILLLSAVNIVSAQSIINNRSKIPPIVKSAILPGWGEYELNNKSRGNFFLTTEIIGIALTTFSFIKSKNISTTYQAIAAEHADVIVGGKNHQFWVDIGNYNSQLDYNDEHLRWREFDSLYPNEANWYWNWDTEKKRKEFEELRVESDRIKLLGKFFIGGIVLNHIISTIDVYYLKNISLKEKLEVSTHINPDNYAVVYSINLKL
ncbi:MAG: hypothetical protein V3R52_03910 [Candidatus Neomarinimicrobiota bacterium]